MIRRFLTRILMVILIGACGYNAWQVHQLQGQVQRLQSRTAVTRQGDVPPMAETPVTVRRSWLDQADLHAARARAAVLRADFPTAQRELLRGVDDVHRSAEEPVAKTQATLDQARHTLAALRSQSDSLWRQLHAAPTGP